MEIECQVSNVDLSKKLRELGVKQDSQFFWINPEYTINNIHTLMFIEDTYLKEHWPAPDFYFSSFTVAELGEMLPCNYFNFYKNEDGYLFSIAGAPNITCENEADARAKMLIYLIENKMMEVPK